MQSCGVPLQSAGVIRLGHGSGGKLTEQLIERIFLPRFGNPILNQLDDAAVFSLGDSRLAFTTDSYVVNPLFFPGGDIGSLSVHGTVNDLSMKLARPLYLSVSFIIEEGFSLQHLEQIVESLNGAAAKVPIQIVAGDTKVVNRGAGDGIFINTTGIGIIQAEFIPSASKAHPGDIVIVSGDIGRHGVAIMCARDGLELETSLESDSATLHEVTSALAPISESLHCLRDLTRGGLSSALNEIANSSNVGIDIDEQSIPIHSSVRGVCELLGLDPLYVACEGRFVSIVDAERADLVLELLKQHDVSSKSVVIGSVTAEHPGRVVAKTAIGGRRIVDKLTGDQLPRIC